MNNDYECEVCGKVYDNTDYIDVFTNPQGQVVCERCVPYDLDSAPTTN